MSGREPFIGSLQVMGNTRKSEHTVENMTYRHRRKKGYTKYKESKAYYVTLAGKVAQAAAVLCGLQGDLPFFRNLPVLSTMNTEHDFSPQG